jgi:hypothetical protein
MFSLKKDSIAKFVADPKLPKVFYANLGFSAFSAYASLAVPFLSASFFVWQFSAFAFLLVAWMIYESWKADVKLHRYNLRQMLEFAQKHPDYIAKFMGK